MKLIYIKGVLKVTDIENPVLDIVCDGDITFYTPIPSLMLHKEYEINNVIAYASDEMITESLK